MILANPEQRASIKARREARKAELAALSAKAEAKEAQRVAQNRAALAAGPGKAEPPSPKQSRHEESDMQQRCVAWFRLQYKRELLFAVPNGTQIAGSAKQRAMRADRLKAEGMLPGVSDLILVHDGGVVFLEAKTATGRLSPAQRLFRAMVTAMGFEYVVFRGFEEFQYVISKALNK